MYMQTIQSSVLRGKKGGGEGGQGREGIQLPDSLKDCMGLYGRCGGPHLFEMCL